MCQLARRECSRTRRRVPLQTSAADVTGCHTDVWRRISDIKKRRESWQTRGTGAGAGEKKKKENEHVAFSLAMLVRQLQTWAAHEPVDRLEFRAKSPLARTGIQKQKARPAQTLTGTRKK